MVKALGALLGGTTSRGFSAVELVNHVPRLQLVSRMSPLRQATG